MKTEENVFLKRIRSIIRLFLALPGILPELILLGMVIYLVVRFTVRDSYVVTRYLFYLPTLPVATACFAALIVRLIQWRRMWVAAAVGAALLVTAYCFFSDEFRLAGPRANPGDTRETLKVITWNIQNGCLGWDAVAERIRREDPDLIMLVEVHIWKSPWKRKVWLKEFPGYKVARIDGPLTILTKGKVLWHKYDNVNRARFLRAGLEIDGRRLNVIVFHPRSHIREDKEATYRKLAEFIDEFDEDTPLILSGDFNVPPNSAYLDRIEARLRNAFHEAGSGSYYSWPSRLPLLAIDHTFVNGCVEVLSYHIEPTSLSDHYIQKMEIILKPASQD